MVVCQCWNGRKRSRDQAHHRILRLSQGTTGPFLSLTPRFSGVIQRARAHETVFNGFILLMPLEPVSLHEHPQFCRKAALAVMLLLLGKCKDMGGGVAAHGRERKPGNR